MAKLAIAAIALLLQASPSLAQAPAAPADEVWPFPPPDPMSWWTEPRPKGPEAADPLAGRKPPRRGPVVDGGVEPSLYRLWGLPPLQHQVLGDGEMILELWTRPSRGVRQTVTRILVRRDGRAFVQARAGLACCEPGIERRVGFDAELPAGAATRFLALRDHSMWQAPRAVRVVEGGGDQAVCLDGVAYDVTLVVPGRARSLRRACDDAEIGQIADAAEPVLAAALGHEPRFDVLFPGGADFSAARAAYEGLVAGGGRLAADPDAPRSPPS